MGTYWYFAFGWSYQKLLGLFCAKKFGPSVKQALHHVDPPKATLPAVIVSPLMSLGEWNSKRNFRHVGFRSPKITSPKLLSSCWNPLPAGCWAVYSIIQGLARPVHLWTPQSLWRTTLKSVTQLSSKYLAESHWKPISFNLFPFCFVAWFGLIWCVWLAVLLWFGWLALIFIKLASVQPFGVLVVCHRSFAHVVNICLPVALWEHRRADWCSAEVPTLWLFCFLASKQ